MLFYNISFLFNKRNGDIKKEQPNL